MAELRVTAQPQDAIVEASEAGPRIAERSTQPAGSELDAAAIMSALEENRWNRRATADALQITYKALLYKIKQYDLTSKTA